MFFIKLIALLMLILNINSIDLRLDKVEDGNVAKGNANIFDVIDDQPIEDQVYLNTDDLFIERQNGTCHVKITEDAFLYRTDICLPTVSEYKDEIKWLLEYYQKTGHFFLPIEEIVSTRRQLIDISREEEKTISNYVNGRNQLDFGSLPIREVCLCRKYNSYVKYLYVMKRRNPDVYNAMVLELKSALKQIGEETIEYTRNKNLKLLNNSSKDDTLVNLEIREL